MQTKPTTDTGKCAQELMSDGDGCPSDMMAHVDESIRVADEVSETPVTPDISRAKVGRNPSLDSEMEDVGESEDEASPPSNTSYRMASYKDVVGATNQTKDGSGSAALLTQGATRTWKPKPATSCARCLVNGQPRAATAIRFPGVHTRQRNPSCSGQIQLCVHLC